MDNVRAFLNKLGYVASEFPVLTGIALFVFIIIGAAIGSA